MTCKDCIHYDACEEMQYRLSYGTPQMAGEGAEKCKWYADKSLYIKLPCKAGTHYDEITKLIEEVKAEAKKQEEITYG